MKKIKTIFLISLLLSASIIVMVNNESDVEAAGGGGEGEKGKNSMGLNLSYMWEVTWWLANVTHNKQVYPDGSIPKGRYFGSAGGLSTADYLVGELNKLAPTLKDVDKIEIKSNTGKEPKKMWKYNYTVNVDDFWLKINGQNYEYSNKPVLSMNATYIQPTGSGNLIRAVGPLFKLDYTNNFTSLKLVAKNLTQPLEYNADYYTSECTDITDYNLTIGNATYINNTDTLPPDQEGRVFLLDEEEGVNETLENITSNASAVVLIKDSTRDEDFQADTSECNVSMIVRVYKNESNNNISKIIELLKNGTTMIADNFLTDGVFNFSYNFNCIDWSWCELNNFMYVTPHGEYTYDFWDNPDPEKPLDSNYFRIIKHNWFNLTKCLGIIAYDINVYGGSTHLMWPPVRQWPGWADTEEKQLEYYFTKIGPLIQTIFVNNTVGRSLENISNDPDGSISGHITQSAGNVLAYNVIGNITIPHSPNDNVTIVSNRYDSLWSEAPGDSGAGAGIVLGIAKYFHDYEIKPKYNLTFLFTTGEENGYRGAWHFNDSHNESEFNINRFIGTDQLGFNQANSYFNPILSGDITTKKIMGVIANDTMYEERTNYSFKAKSGSNFNGLDPYPFQRRSEYCDTIVIHKTAEDPNWYGHHRSGEWFQEGDSMKYTDRKDLEVTFEYAWNVTKYYCVDPDCWYKNADITVSDSDDEGTLVDTVTISYDVRSILPHDLAMNRNSLGKAITNDIVTNETTNFTINRSEISKSFSITLPSGESPGYYVFHNKLFNSTGRINEILSLYSNNYNQSTYSDFIFLYPYGYNYEPPIITNINVVPDPVGYGGSVTISADVTSNNSSIDSVKVNIYKPQDTSYGTASSYNMTNTEGDTYEYVFNNTWQHGMYNYTIWAEDANGNETGSSQHSFNVSAQATVSVCTVQDEYGNNTWVNITDPPTNPPQVGYELLDNGEVLRIWNRLDSYYFDTSSGIQLTNHYDEYWSHNVLMLGYYNNDEWNPIYRTDEISGFNKNITSGEGFVNVTLWKDLSYSGYDFRLAIRYHLGVDDNELTAIPYIKNLDDEDIPYNLGFAWEIKDIQIDMTPGGDYIEINGTTYYLNQTLEETYTNLDDACFYIREDHAGDTSESLYLRWDEDLSYKVKVESRDGQYNAPVTLGIKIGTLEVGQEKYTNLFWHDAFEKIYYFNSYNVGETWATSPGNMVDGSTSYYASTTNDGDIELCDANNCSTSDLGVIAKVELRAYGYYSGYQRDTILRPVFGGTTDGFNYPQRTNATPSWSEWTDITHDFCAPQTWSWSDVENLDCDVEADMGYGLFTLYCSKVEIRVTYAPNNDPVISDPVPVDDSMGISIAPVLNITVSDLDGDNMNITWLSNSSGSWVAFGTNNSVNNGTYHQTFCNASVNGKWWYWKVNVTDGTDYTESSVYKFYTGYESKIKNTGSTNISGYVFMQVQYYDEEIEEWVVVTDCQNDTTPRTINAGEQFGLDTVFNGKVYSSDLIASFGNGSYRVYACFRDPDDDVLICDDETLMEDSYEFTVSES